ncbi:unnamed protein product [Paramecium sonneborni]|uniref:Uncharacterized protein n=1 Tax=Paramecium sonneborni TaxID=65129 RepID=A0A8S1KLR2_9CILI|nr:unnamed protein product [Paramecium sonneborni]
MKELSKLTISNKTTMILFVCKKYKEVKQNNNNKQKFQKQLCSMINFSNKRITFLEMLQEIMEFILSKIKQKFISSYTWNVKLMSEEPISS